MLFVLYSRRPFVRLSRDDVRCQGLIRPDHDLTGTLFRFANNSIIQKHLRNELVERVLSRCLPATWAVDAQRAGLTMGQQL